MPSSVKKLALALSRTEGRAVLSLSGDNLGDHRLGRVAAGRETLTVPVTTLDAYFADDRPRIDFIKPGRGTVTARFIIDQEIISNIVKHTADGQKYLPNLTVDIKDENGETVTSVVKTLYIRKK